LKKQPASSDNVRMLLQFAMPGAAGLVLVVAGMAVMGPEICSGVGQ
jgi:hypothetical protein